VTIRELAKKLNLSKTTVADAIRGKSQVKPTTRELVLRAAAAYGYNFNTLASAVLQQVRSKRPVHLRANLAFLVPEEMHELGAEKTQLYQGAYERALELGCAMDSICVPKFKAARLTGILLARGIVGIIVGPLIRSVGHLSVDWSKFASVAFGYSMARPSLHRVAPNHLQGIRLAHKMCRRNGFCRIGLALRAEGDARSNGIWSSAFFGIQQKLPRSQRVKPFLVSDAEYTPERIQKWILQEKPDAVLFHNIERLPKLPEIFDGGTGWVVPVFLGGPPVTSCAGIDQRYRACGAQLLDQLALQIVNNSRGIPSYPTVTLIDGKWGACAHLRAPEPGRGLNGSAVACK